ncbi:kynureninase [Exilibacterium tricleocarpae]|uniref:Kynureninase n=1 Tax=Exilibacterium tricleocarpae TaxID=2591008 RepID=A0A545SYW0_9GAMM|nr:kynureninase [Exilibacterium tricleocarpae]TQV70155.1 kynureninase [Exilibacterium tricleocarpae]
MQYDLNQYRQHPNRLAQHYRHFNVAERLLLTGHSHQAWPDCGLAGHQQAWLDAAEWVDAKWERAAARAADVRRGFAALLDDRDGHIALGQNTFELVLRFLSALDLRKRPRVVTSANEFHTLRRLLGRLEEEGLEVVRVPAEPFDSFIERLAGEVNDATAAVLCSHVFFDSAIIAGNFSPVAAACERVGCELLIDAYHSLNVVPFALAEHGLERAFVVSGGYKYCQLGEGNCFLRFPRDCTLRPIATGWFGEFEQLAEAGGGQTAYGTGPERFAGSTYDPTSHYRAAEVLQFFRNEGLVPALLRQISQHQVGVLAAEFEALDIDSSLVDLRHRVELDRRAGFLALNSPQAKRLHLGLKERGVMTDHRGEILRFGPAPYLSDQQLTEAMAALGEVAGNLGRR